LGKGRFTEGVGLFSSFKPKGFKERRQQRKNCEKEKQIVQQVYNAWKVKNVNIKRHKYGDITKI